MCGLQQTRRSKLSLAVIVTLGLLSGGGRSAMGQEREVPLADGVLVRECDSASTDERDVCLAGLALRTGTPSICDSAPEGRCQELAARAAMAECGRNHEGSLRHECEMATLTSYPAPDACVASLDPTLCILTVASERREPNLIAERVSDEQEMQRIMAAYVASARDPRGLDYITDPFVHDGALTNAAFAIGYGQDRELGTAYCDRLRGGYGRNHQDVSAETMAALCRHISAMSDQLLSLEGSSEFPSEREQLHERFLSEIEQAVVGLESGELELADVLPGGGDGGEATVERGGPSPDAGGKYCELIYSYHCPDDEYYPPFYDSGRWGGGSDCGETDLPGGYYVYYVDTWYVYRSVCP